MTQVTAATGSRGNQSHETGTSSDAWFGRGSHHGRVSGAIPTAQWTPLRIAAAVVGAVFLVVGVLGFIPGVTTNYDSMEWAGHSSDAQLLGLFNVSILHNVRAVVGGDEGVGVADVAGAELADAALESQSADAGL